MGEKHDIDTCSKLELGAAFFLQESFRHIDSALSNEFASILFSEELEKLEPSEADRAIIETMDLPNTAVGILQSDIPDVLTDETLNKISNSWHQSQIKANTGKHKFGLNHKIDSIEILGHLNNFGFFIETLIKRHLLFLKQPMR